MSLKIIQLTISNTDVPIDVSVYTPEENTFLLKMGIKCLEESKKYAVSLSQEEIYEKIKQESREDIRVLENTILLEKELGKKTEEYTKRIYQTQIDRLETRVETLLQQIKGYECENDEKIQVEVKRVQEKCELLLFEKDKQNQLNRESFEKAIHLHKYKSMKERGTDGEDEFADLADTFRDFPGYRIENMSKQGHKGDFHLFFEEFTVLVDLKKYTVNVNKKEIDKIEMDLQTNDHMDYAWLISLNSEIHGWNRFSIMYKWIITEKGPKCIFFVNNLLENKDPKNILRNIWAISNEFQKLTRKEDRSGDDALQKYKDRDVFLHKHVKNMQERANEMRRNLIVSTNILKQMDAEIIEIMSVLSNEIMSNEYDKYQTINQWFESHIEYVGNEYKVSSLDIWTHFKRMNKEYIVENKITIDIFKDIIKRMIDSSKYMERSKKGSFDLIGFKIKQENISIEIVESVKSKKIKPYFDKERDEIIIGQYNEMDIIEIGENIGIRPWEVVSVLVRYKIIQSRGEARGYDRYKQTDEYKNKLATNCHE